MVYVLPLIFFFKIEFLVAQDSQSIKGKVLEKITHEFLPYANVQLLDSVDSSLVSFSITDKAGNFTIPIKGQRTYLLKISYLGYDVNYFLLNQEYFLEEVIVFLERSEVKLNEVIIEESSPAVVRNDTTTFNLDKYRKNGELSLGEILENLPNFRVEEGGVVYYKNKRIDKVMIEGEDLIGENYRAAIKSLDPSVLNEVQVIENFQDNRFLSGLEIGQKTVLNLGVKEDRKQLFFGSIGLGAGPQAHNSLANLFLFQGRFKAYFLGTTNNVGIRREEISAERSVEELSNFSRIWSFSSVQRIESYIPYFLKTTYENPNRERFGNVNFVYRVNKKINLVSNFNIYGDRNDFVKENNTQFILDQPFFIRQTDTLFRAPQMIEHRVKAEFNLDENTGLKLDNLLYFNDNFLGQRLIFDTGGLVENRLQNMSNARSTWNLLLEFTRRLDDSNALVLGAYTRREVLQESLRSELLPPPDIKKEDVIDIDQFLGHSMLQTGVQLRWLYARKHMKIENQLSHHYQRYHISDQIQGFNENLAGIFSKTSSYLQNLTWEKGNLNFNYSHRVEYQGLESVFGINRSRWNWQPNAMIKVEFDDNNTIIGGYGVEIQPVHGTVLVDRPLFSDFRTAFQGINILDWNKQINYNLGYHYSDIFKRKISVNTSLFWITNPTLWTLNTMELQPELVFMQLGKTSINDSKGLMIKVDKLAYFIKGSIRLDLNLWQSTFEEVVNNQERVGQSVISAVGYRYLSAFQGLFNLEFKGYFQNNRMNVFQGDELLKNSFINSKQSVVLISKFDKITSRLIAENFGIEGQNFQFINYRVDYNYNGKLNFYSEGRNLLGTKSFFMARFTPNQFLQESYSLLGRIILVGVHWNF